MLSVVVPFLQDVLAESVKTLKAKTCIFSIEQIMSKMERFMKKILKAEI